MFEDLTVELDPPPNRRGKCGGEKERHLTEATVMLAYGMHLLRTVPGLLKVELHPDGEHAKRFEIPHWLNARGFLLSQGRGTTAWGGTYVSGQQAIAVTSIPRHPGQVSRLRKGPCEAVGLLMAIPPVGRQLAVVPYTETTLRLAKRMAPARRAQA